MIILAIVIVLITSAIIVIFINLYCIWVIYSKNGKKPSDMAIGSLVISHAIQGLIVIPCYTAKKHGVYRHTLICEVFRFTYLFTNYCCCLSVLVISLDRFIGVQFPLRYQLWITTKRMSTVLVCVWFYVLIFCLIPFIPSGETECYYNPQDQWVLTMLFVHTLLPFIVISLCYVVIISKIKTAIRRRKKTVVTASANNARQQMKISVMTASIVSAYVLCWGPGFIYYLLDVLCAPCFHKNFHHTPEEDIIRFAMKYLTFVDGFIAPLIYCCANASFKEAGKKAIAKARKKFSKGKDHYVGGWKSTTNTIETTEESLLRDNDNEMAITWNENIQLVTSV